MSIRHYGLLVNRCRRKSLKIIRKILAQSQEHEDKQQKNEPVAIPCPKCKRGHLIAIYEINPVWPFNVSPVDEAERAG